MLTVTVQQRRAMMTRRHCLAGDSAGPEHVTDALIALHATDPASVYLSVLARSAGTTLAGVAAAMYERRSLVRWMAMRRTLFVFARDDISMVQAAVSAPLATMLRRRLLSRLDRNGTEPPIGRDLTGWLAELEDLVERAVERSGCATGAQLAADVPELNTTIAARTPSERPQHLTSSLLTLMSAEGRLVRAVPTGEWTSRHHRWEPLTAWWPDGIPSLDPVDAQRELARRWLTRFGPATVEDLAWWTGWSKTTTGRALAGLALDDVDLHGQPGITLADSNDGDDAAAKESEPVATLLPALDPTPMGWRHREWFLAVDPTALYDRAGNIGPTVWWNGEIIGSWAVTSGGHVHHGIVADRGADAAAAVSEVAAGLEVRLEGTTVTPAVRTPLERSLA